MKTIELIDKYEVRQSKEGDYNPPSYKWIDNTGELIRCEDCEHFRQSFRTKVCLLNVSEVKPNDYCSHAERKEE